MSDDGSDDFQDYDFHSLLDASNWEDLLKLLTDLKEQEPDIVEYALSILDDKNSTPIHKAVWKAPIPLAKLMITVVPLEARETILLKQDADGNTPLHLCCANLELKSDESLDTSVIKLLTESAPTAHETLNWQNDSPSHLLLTSAGFHAVPDNYRAEAAAEDLLKSILGDRQHLTTAQNAGGATLLHAAAAHGSYERVLMALLEMCPESADLKDENGMLPLHYVAACVSGVITSPIFVHRLVSRNPGSVMSQCQITSDTPLHLFVSNAKRNMEKHDWNSRNSTRIAEILLGSSDDESLCPLFVRNKDSLSPLHCCALFNTPAKVVRVLIEWSPFASKALTLTDENKATPMHLACASSSVESSTEIVELLGTAEAACQTDKEGNAPMHVAAENPKSTKELFKVLADIEPNAAKIENSRGDMPLHVAVHSQASGLVIKTLHKIYYKAAQRVFRGENNILHEACQQRIDPIGIQSLLKTSDDIASSKNRYGNIPLHVATAYQAPREIVELLVEAYPKGCLVQNNNGDVPLHYAANYPATAESAKLLARSSPESCKVTNEAGETPLDRAKAVKMDDVTLSFLMKHAVEKSDESDKQDNDDDSEVSVDLNDLDMGPDEYVDMNDSKDNVSLSGLTPSKKSKKKVSKLHASAPVLDSGYDGKGERKQLMKKGKRSSLSKLDVGERTPTGKAKKRATTADLSSTLAELKLSGEADERSKSKGKKKSRSSTTELSPSSLDKKTSSTTKKKSKGSVSKLSSGETDDLLSTPTSKKKKQTRASTTAIDVKPFRTPQSKRPTLKKLKKSSSVSDLFSESNELSGKAKSKKKSLKETTPPKDLGDSTKAQKSKKKTRASTTALDVEKFHSPQPKRSSLARNILKKSSSFSDLFDNKKKSKKK